MTCNLCDNTGTLSRQGLVWACPCPAGDPHREGYISKAEAALAKKRGWTPRPFRLKTWGADEKPAALSARDRAAGADRE